MYYDPLIAKISTWGQDREQARRRMEAALRQCVVLGPTTNVAFLLDLIAHPAFIAGETHTGFLDEHFPQWRPEEKPYMFEALLAAALSQSRQSHTETPTSQAASASSPWQRLGGWRLGG